MRPWMVMVAKNKPKVYLAASSADMDRARMWRARLRDAGVDVLADWLEVVADVGDANPRDANKSQRLTWSAADLRRVQEANLFWLLVPPVDRQTRGAWFEAGLAYCLARQLVFSGDTKQSIFCATGIEHESDEDAFRAILSIFGLGRVE